MDISFRLRYGFESIRNDYRRIERVFTTKWSTSERKYDVIVERDIKVSMPDGTFLDGNIYRPASSERFPVILGAHPYNKDLQSPPMRPIGFTPMRG